MINNFTSVSFTTNSLHDSAYTLSLTFKSAGNAFVRTFIFLETPPVDGRVQDIFTKNGVCQTFSPIQPFTKRELKEAKSTLPLCDPLCQTVAVFDFSDSEKRYLEGTNIYKAELSVVSLFQEAKIKALIPAQFILCEGSLKHDLLKGLSDPEIEFLNSKEGAKTFCECAEYFMNGMKLGGAPREFDFHKYFRGLGNSPYKPVKVSTVFYPEQYKTIYSPSSPFAETLIPVFSVTGNYSDSTKITTLHVERKK